MSRSRRWPGLAVRAGRMRSRGKTVGWNEPMGVSEMPGAGLKPVPTPSKLFLSERASGTPGSAVLCCVEGSRPILVEVQALVSTSTYGNARRMAIGIDQNRLSLLLAVLEKRQMRKHFGVSRLVARGDLDDVVEHHDAAVGNRVEDFNLLVTARFLGHDTGELHALRVAFVKPLSKHFGFFVGHVSPRSCTSLRAS